MTTGLLIIDLQRGMFGGTPHDGVSVLSRVAQLLEKARSRGIAVLHVRHDGGSGDYLERDTPGWEIHPAVAPQGDEPIIDKDRCSAFDATDLHEQLQMRGITQLVIAGMQTDYCIDTNCRAAHGLGYTVSLVRDAHTTFDNPVLPAEQIVAHHNLTLRNGGFVTLVEADAVEF